MIALLKEDLYISINRFVELTGISRRTIEGRIKESAIISRKDGRLTMINVSAYMRDLDAGLFYDLLKA